MRLGISIVEVMDNYSWCYG